MLIAGSQVWGLAAACALLIVVPGPSVLFIVGRALSYGRGTALASVVGNAVGCYLVAVCVALGLGALLTASATVFVVLKHIGAAYLVWLGVQAVRHAGRAPSSGHDSHVDAPVAAPADRRGTAGGRPWRSMRTGVVVAVTNPKPYVVFAAVLPPFVDPAAGHVLQQLLVLALVPITLGLVSDTAWAMVAGRARTWLSGTPARLRTTGRVGGASMIGLGFLLAATDSGH
ncbi:LysE family translocator [Kineococcus sp. SYSU DK001]|uniref:LysE family translocator n=1 Tax=Kineococcus sp. SYSU DK001 TaxID=3383122 RepID=UPI003D7EF9F7